MKAWSPNGTVKLDMAGSCRSCWGSQSSGRQKKASLRSEAVFALEEATRFVITVKPTTRPTLDLRVVSRMYKTGGRGAHTRKGSAAEEV